MHYSGGAEDRRHLDLHYFGGAEDRRHLSNKNKNFVIYFVLHSICTIFDWCRR